VGNIVITPYPVKAVSGIIPSEIDVFQMNWRTRGEALGADPAAGKSKGKFSDYWGAAGNSS
jgi:hypothetical protein